MIYGCENVLCPFYKDETKNSIRCEGIFSEALSNNFKDTKSKMQHKINFCCDNYLQCALFSPLENKYE